MDYSKLVVPAGQQAKPESSTAKKQVLGLDFLSTLKVAERVEYTVPFPVRLTFTPVYNKERVMVDAKDIRFYTSDLVNASFEVAPAFPAGFMVDAESSEVGTLVVSCAKQDSMFKAEVDEIGHTQYKFAARPEFVSFNGRKAVKFADAKKVGINMLALKAAAAGVTLPTVTGEDKEAKED